jgi:hypothetical protein
MQTFSEIVEKIKELKGLKYDYEVAELLVIKQNTLSTNKTRNSIPIKKITAFCRKENIPIDKLLTGSKSVIYKEGNGEKNSTIKEADSLDYKGQEPARDFKITNAIKMCSYVLESETPYAVALYHNLVGFERAVKNELEHNTCKADLEKANKTVSEMRTRMDGMEEEFKKMKKELKELREHSGGSAPIKLTMDHAAPTGTEDKER